MYFKSRQSLNIAKKITFLLHSEGYISKNKIYFEEKNLTVCVMLPVTRNCKKKILKKFGFFSRIKKSKI
jgi:hypothetical protein